MKALICCKFDLVAVTSRTRIWPALTGVVLPQLHHPVAGFHIIFGAIQAVAKLRTLHGGILLLWRAPCSRGAAGQQQSRCSEREQFAGEPHHHVCLYALRYELYDLQLIKRS